MRSLVQFLAVGLLSLLMGAVIGLLVHAPRSPALLILCICGVLYTGLLLIIYGVDRGS